MEIVKKGEAESVRQTMPTHRRKFSLSLTWSLSQQAFFKCSKKQHKNAISKDWS